MAYKGPKLADLHGAKRAARIKELLGNPGTRKLVPTADLPASYRQQRNLNARLNSPIVQGSSTTQRDLAHSREAAVTTQFGPNAVGAYQQREKDTGGWYDQYLAELEKHRQNVEGFGTQAQGQVANLGNVQGPAGSAPQDPGVQGAAANAAAVRSALLGAMQGQLSGQGRAANTYADTLAHVVAPGQKVQALTAARGATDELRGKIGAFRTQFEQQAKTDEGKNVLAQQALTGKTAAQQAQDAIDAARAAETARHNRAVENKPPSASEQKTQQQIDFFNKHGYYPTTGKPKKTKGRAGQGPDWRTQGETGKGLSQAVSLRDFAAKAKGGQSFVAGHGKQKPLDRSGAADKIKQAVASPDDPVLLTAALDAAYDGHLSPATVQKLIKAGYKPSRVAEALGVPTGQQARKGGGVTKPKMPKGATLFPPLKKP
jgi:hypothetical protein